MTNKLYLNTCRRNDITQGFKIHMGGPEGGPDRVKMGSKRGSRSVY